ncbi:MetQ/NlpA family ABC transporter substrate-binding protein [Bacillus sp. 03113]|uniref:MetQ/NlpA family ABC transporter substrate-binding protein n=1 Tax=Bacillus sp. 03113 TaxID=2578211 RepID=UPI0011422EF3|nr:MetQ/NlpA family ABC transporter substrate-binding protein [Bacillus sp. 03113]
MKKWLSFLLILAVAVVTAACGTTEKSGEKETTKLTVGASNVPHAEILEEAKPLLEKKGIDLEIVKFQDYILPNQALASKEIDANYFQHVPYLEKEIAEKGYDFVNAGGIHIEPIGVYSKKYKSLNKLPKNAVVIMRDSVSEHGRILSLFEKEGVIKLKEGVNKVNATIDDIAENPKNIKFEAKYEAALLPQIYKNNEGDAVVINANYALDTGLDPVKDPISVESGENNPYANIITVRKEDENKKEIKTLVEVLRSKDIQDFINKKYKGAVLPVSE